MGKLEMVTMKEEVYYYSLSFDIDDFYGNGIYWLQVYDNEKRMIYDKPFASSRGNIDTCRIAETIKQVLLFMKRII